MSADRTGLLPSNPLSHQVDALRGLLLGAPDHFALDFAELFVAAALGIAAASSLARPPRALIMLMDVMCGTPAGRGAPPVGEFFLRTA